MRKSFVTTNHVTDITYYTEEPATTDDITWYTEFTTQKITTDATWYTEIDTVTSSEVTWVSEVTDISTQNTCYLL